MATAFSFELLAQRSLHHSTRVHPPLRRVPALLRKQFFQLWASLLGRRDQLVFAVALSIRASRAG